MRSLYPCPKKLDIGRLFSWAAIFLLTSLEITKLKVDAAGDQGRLPREMATDLNSLPYVRIVANYLTAGSSSICYYMREYKVLGTLPP